MILSTLVMSDDFFEFLNKIGIKTEVLVDNPLKGSKEDVARYLAFDSVNYKILLALKKEPAEYHGLVKELLIDEYLFAKSLLLLSKHKLVFYNFKENNLFIAAPNIKNLMQGFYDSFMASYENRSSYFDMLLEKQKPKPDASTIYYDFPAKGKAVKKVSLTPEYFKLLKDLSDKIKHDFLD